MTQHETYIHGVRSIVVDRIQDEQKQQRVASAKLVYGAGQPGTRGVTYFDAWKNGCSHDFIEVCACGEESALQLAGTTIHELAHCLAGPLAGHGKEWKEACRVLGLNHAQAAGQQYATEHFDAEVIAAVEQLEKPADGAPVFGDRHGLSGLPFSAKLRPCSLGIGTRGGKSRGAGSGSRLRLFVCECGVKVRVAKDEFHATCDDCHTSFKRVEPGEKKPAASVAVGLLAVLTGQEVRA